MAHLVAQPATLWDVPIVPTLALLFVGATYVRGWLRIRHAHAQELPAWRVWAFLIGLFALFVALASPLDTLADDLLLFHMTQHIFFMSIVPPLFAVGAPLVPFLQGLPRIAVRYVASPLLRSRTLNKLAIWITAPAVASALMIVAFVLWHLPALYELAVRSQGWHDVEHLSFLVTSVVFWWKIVEPWPVHRPWSPWTKLACLFAADLGNTAVSAYLSFCGHVIYPSYNHLSRSFAISPLNDQSGAGAEMWVINSLVFLIPAMMIPVRALAPRICPEGSMNRDIQTSQMTVHELELGG